MSGPARSRFCRCPDPQRELDGDGVAYCGDCQELLPSNEQELLGAICRKVDRLARALDSKAPATPRAAPPGWLTVAEVAAMIGVDRSYVYQHADDLGALRLPSGGGRGRLRFDPAEVRRRAGQTEEGPQKAAQRPRRPSKSTGQVPLLPIAGGEK